MGSSWRIELLIWTEALRSVVQSTLAPVRLVRRVPTLVLGAVVAAGLVLWWGVHQPVGHNHAWLGAIGHVVKDDAGVRMVGPGWNRKLLGRDEVEVGEVMMEPRFEDNTELDPVRSLRHVMHAQANPGAELPDEAWLRREFSKIVAQHAHSMSVCPRCAEFVAEGDGPTAVVNWPGIVFLGVFWVAVVGLVGSWRA